jgi:hypothetical protein
MFNDKSRNICCRYTTFKHLLSNEIISTNDVTLKKHYGSTNQMFIKRVYILQNPLKKREKEQYNTTFLKFLYTLP